MSEQRRAIIIETGMNNAGVLAGIKENEVAMNSSLARVLAAVTKYQQKQTDVEIGAATRRNQARQLLRDRELVQATRHAEAMAAIQSGSTPANMAGGAVKKAEHIALIGFEAGATVVSGGYVFSKTGVLLGKIGANGEIEKDLIKGAEGAAEHSTGTAIKQEAMVLVRETFRGAGISRIIASAMRLVALAGDALLGLAFTYVAIPGAIAAAFFEGLPKLVSHLFSPSSFLGKNYGTSVGDWWSARAGEKGSAAELKNTRKSDAEMLRQRVRMMQKRDIISDSQARDISANLDDPSGAGLLAGFSLTNPLMGRLHGSQIHDESIAASRAGLTTGQSKYTFDLVQQHLLLEKIHTLKKGSVAFDTTAAALQKNSVDLADDQVEMEKDIAEAKKKSAAADKKAAADAKELRQELYNNEREQVQVLGQSQGDDLRGIPSLDAAAGGNGFLTRLARRFLRTNKGSIQGMSRAYIQQQYGMGADFERYSLATGGSYGDWLKTSQGAGEKSYLERLAGPLRALGIVKNDDLGGKLDDLNTINKQIHDKLSHVGLADD